MEFWPLYTPVLLIHCAGVTRRENPVNTRTHLKIIGYLFNGIITIVIPENAQHLSGIHAGFNEGWIPGSVSGGPGMTMV